MYLSEVESVGVASEKKIQLLKRNFLGYFISAMLAGVYVGFGVILVFGIGSCIVNNPMIKVVMGLSFGVTLSLVVIAGFENSVACMTLLSVAFLAPFENIMTLMWYILHIGVLTLGNMVGGIFFVALPYYLISRKDKIIK